MQEHLEIVKKQFERDSYSKSLGIVLDVLTEFRQAEDYAFAYMDGLNNRSVFPTQEAIEALCAFDESLPQGPSDPDKIIALLHEKGSPATVAQTRGRYFGFVNGGAIPVAVAAKWLSDV
jgi:hypothetical protein